MRFAPHVRTRLRDASLPLPAFSPHHQAVLHELLPHLLRQHVQDLPLSPNHLLVPVVQFICNIQDLPLTPNHFLLLPPFRFPFLLPPQFHPLFGVTPIFLVVVVIRITV